MEKRKIGKMLVCATAMLLATYTFAIPRGPCEPKEKPVVCCDEPAPGPFAFSYPKDIGLSCPHDLTFFADFLLMQTKQDGMDYAIIKNNATTNAFPINGGDIQGYSTDDHSWDWNLGARLGFSFILNHDAWSVNAEWMYVRLKEDSGRELNNGVFLPYWLPPSSAISLGGNNTSASQRWTGHFNSVDVYLGKPYHISRYVIFTPYFGIRAAWIEQNKLSRYGGDFGSYANLQEEAKNDFWGVGARAGVNSEWMLGAGWHIFGNIGASLLYSHFDVDQEIHTGSSTFAEIEHDFYTNTPNVDIQLGLRWTYKFSKDKYRFGLKAAYEFHHWWRINRYRRFLDDTAPSSNEAVSAGDLSFNGFAFGLLFDF